MPYGRRGGESVVNQQLVGSQYAPSIAGFDSGGFVVVWWTTDTVQDGAGFAIKAQRYDTLGNAVGGETLVNSSATGDQRAPSVTTLSSGGYVVTWETSDTTQDGSGRAIKGQLFDASGGAVGAEFRVNTQSTADQVDSSVTGLAGGGFVVTWQSADPAQDGHSSAIKGQIYSASGVAVGSEFLVNTGAVGFESMPSVTSLGSGGFVATWTLGSGTSADVYAQVFSSTGAKMGGQFLVSNRTVPNQTTTALHQGSPDVTEISGGRFVVTWQSWNSLNTGDTEIRARVFAADGTPLGDDFRVSTTHNHPDFAGMAGLTDPKIENLPNGGFVITWTYAYGSYPRSAIHGQFFDSSGNRVGSEVIVSTVTNRGEGDSDMAVDGNGRLFAVWSSSNQSGADYDIRGQLFSPTGAPEIVSNGGADAAAVTVAENQNAVTTVSAVDPEGSTSLVYSIVGGLDASRFAINASTGVLTFVSPPNFESRVDFSNNNVYDVVVSVSDGVHTDIQALAVTVSNVNEAPVLGYSETSFFHIENRTAVATFSATDPDGTAVTWSIAGGADAALFAIDPVTGALRFIAGPDFEAPADAGANNFYNVIISAGDGSLFATRALTIEIANWNEGPVIISGGGGATASVSVAENTGFITTVVADDPDVSNSPFSFSIAGGADSALFSINATTGQLFFASNGRNYEAPTDANGDNVYEVVVAVADSFNPADTQAISVTVTDANDAPVITSNGGGFLASVSLPENQLAVTTVTASDFENAALTYAIAGGADAARFAINPQTGVLSFVSAPNFEAPSDVGANNVYNVTVSVSDGDKTDTQQLTITILNANDAPVITSNGGGSAASVSVAEGGLAVTNVAATDLEGAALSYAISGGADASRFLIDSATGALSFLATPDFEQPSDAGGNNVYDVTVTASDGVLSDSQALSITVGNANERPVIVSNGGGTSAFVEIDEGQTAVTTVAAADPDGAGSITYSISGGMHADLFTIDSATGALSFAAAPDYEAPLGESSNFYSVTVTASDGELSSFQSVQVGVRDVNEGVTITSGASASVGENGTAVMTVTAQDLDGDPVSYSISGGADAGLFQIDSATGALSFLAAPNFEAPADSNGDNVYDVEVSASDGTLSDSRSLAVTVTGRNEGISITSNGGGSSAALTSDEGISHVTTVVASDPDGVAPTYSITGGNDASLFTIDAATGVLRFVDAPDYENRLDALGASMYEVIVTASDGELSSSQFLSVWVRNVNEAVTITSAGGADSVAVTVDEDQGLVANVDAVDADGTPVYYSIAGGADAAFFGIDPLTGELHIAGADYDSPGDSDGDNVYEVIVAADDGWLSDTQAYSVTLADVDEPLSFTSYASDFYVTLEADENGLDAAVVAAEDPEGRAIVYSIVDSYDGASFTIDAATGVIRFAAAPNHEAPGDLDGDNVYTVLVAATDGTFFDYQNISIQVRDVNERPAIASPASATVAENGTAVSTVTAVDPEGGSVSYAIAGGADASRFSIDAQTGALSFVQAPDFEAPADSDGDNVYDVVVSATDGTLTDSRAMAVTVTNANENVAITSDGSGASALIWTLENDTAVTVVAASDPDGGPVTYAITGGADADRFTIDSTTGALTFVTALDLEALMMAGVDNVFDVTVSASDGSSTDSQALTVILDNVVEGVFITSYGGADSVSVTLTEGYYARYDVDAWHDTEAFAPTYTLSGPDAAFFTIDNHGRFGFDYDAPPNFEGPADADGDNVYEVTVITSASTYSDSQSFSITIVNRDEAAVFTSGGGEPFASFTMAENGTVATTLSAVDPEGGAVTYAIYGGFDAARFTIDPNTGVLSFVDAPDFENPTDAGWNSSGYAEQDNVYNVWITATDGTFVTSQFVDVTVTDVDEPIELLSYGGASAVALTMTEGTGLTVATVEADDEEDWIVTYAITGGADAALFQINAYTGVLAYNYGVYPDFEAPQDAGGDNVYDVVVTASSSTSSVDQTFAITVADRNEGLWITSNGGGDANLTMNEGDRSVTTVTAEDPDGDVPTYSIVGGADAALFAIDPVTGVLTFIAAPDYEAPGSAAGTNSYLVEVGASDGEFTGTQRIRVTIGNVNETPVITSGGGGESAAVTVNENGLVVTSIEADDADDNGLTWSITGGADASLFTIDPWSGILRFVEGPNFEAPGDVGGDNVYDVVVSVTDGVLTDSQALAVTVANLSEAVAITSNGGGAAGAVTVAENGNVVTQVAASDPDGGAVTYAIAGGADAARFTINSSTGALSFVSAPNFEAPADAGGNNVYDVVVSATDGSSTDTQALAVSVGNVNEGVVITSNGGGSSASVAVAENGTAVATVTASDPEGGAVTYAIAGGADSSRFTINAATGALAFIAAPNFEAPGDVGGNNVYDVLVSASDGIFSDTQAIAVQVGNVNEAPAVTSNGGGASAAVSVAENSLAVTIVNAGDPDGTAATYSIVGGADAARFTINPQTGLLQFVAAPDYELPADSNGDNVYAVVVRASDGQLGDDQVLSVTVTNVRDGNNVTGTSASDSISATSTTIALRTSNEEDTVFGRDGHDNIQGMAGDDDLYGEGGNDVLIGGAGLDRLTGGLGKDTYTYNSVSESSVMARDTILDFSRVQGDKISLSAIDSNSLVSNNQAFTFIGTAAFSNVAGQLRYETLGGVTTISGDVDGDAVADLVIQLSGSLALISSDFIL